jgi:hypothetical protein
MSAVTGKPGHLARAHPSVVPEQRQQNDDWNWHPQKP